MYSPRRMENHAFKADSACFLIPCRQNDPVLKPMVHEVLRSAALNVMLGGGVSFLLASTITSRMRPLGRLLGMVGFTSMGAVMGGMMGTRGALREFSKKVKMTWCCIQKHMIRCCIQKQMYMTWCCIQ
jgi:hypothetical protein